MIKKIKDVCSTIADALTIISFLIKLTEFIINFNQNKNNPGGNLWVIFILFLIKVLK